MTTRESIIRASFLSLLIITMLLFAPQPGTAATTVTTTTGTQTIIYGQAAVTIDAGIAVVNDAGDITNGQVLIANGFVPGGDTLSWDNSLATADGITGSFNGTSGLLTFTGTTSPANWQALFRTVTLAPSASSTDTRTVSFTIGNAIPLSDNGHFYEFVASAAIPWTTAESAAAARDLFGLQGYLVTITSLAENDFVAGKLQGEGWMGASDADTESDWLWKTGPEADTQFFHQTGAVASSTTLNTVYGGDSSGGGDPVDGSYSNWQSGEPNDYGSGEDYAHFRDNGTWNDYDGSNNSIAGYVVEYGGMAGDPDVTLTAQRDVAVRLVVTPSAGDGGSITPSSPQTESPNATPAFTITPDAGYHIANVGGTCNGSLVNATYTVNALAANCTVAASFAINTYTLTYSAGAHGTISGPSPQTVTHGGDGSAVTAVPATGYHFVGWSDGAPANPRTDANIVADLNVTANFADTFTVSATEGAGGSIAPTGANSVKQDQTVSFTVTAATDTPYTVAGGTCPDGSWSVGGGQYTTGAITADCTVTFSFYSELNATDADDHVFTGGETVSGTAVNFMLASPGAVTIAAAVTRAGEQTALSAADTAALVTSDGEGRYTFLTDQTGAYELTCTDSASGQEITLEFTVEAQAAFRELRQYGSPDEPVEVEIVLDDVPITYPVVIPYTVQGAALSDDLTTADSVTIDSPERSTVISFTPNTSSGEIVFALSENGMSNAVLGGLDEHTVVLQETGQSMPRVTLTARQAQTSDTLVTAAGGPVTLSAIPAGDGDYHYDWTGSDLDLGIYNESGGTVTVDPTLLDGLYHVQVVVTEVSAPHRSVTLSSHLRVADAVPAAYTDYFNDTYQDDPRRLPICPEGTDVQGCSTAAAPVYLEAPEDYTLRLGAYSSQASWRRSDYGLAVDNGDIVDDRGQEAVNARDRRYTHIGFCVDFELQGLDRPGDSIPLVVPLPDGESIPEHAVWRKYDSQNGWQDFQSDAGNTLYSAPRNDTGDCPGPLSAGWSQGLNSGDTCVRLTIQDGGPNDHDGRADGVIRDPGSLAVYTHTGHGGWGAFGWWSLSVLIGLAGHKWIITSKQRRGRSANREA